MFPVNEMVFNLWDLTVFIPQPPAAQSRGGNDSQQLLRPLVLCSEQ